MKRLLVLQLIFLIQIAAFGQNVSPTDPKMFHLDPANAPKDFKANIKDLEWLVGNWRTDRGANSFRDDTYLPIEGNQITGVNRAIANNQVAYMNYIVIWQDGDTVKMHHKNFGTGLNLRGERDFRLLNKDGDYFYFTGLTLHRVNHDLQEAYFDFGDQKQLQITKRVRVPNQQIEVLELNTEKELYPEGLAVDESNKRIYLNSTNQNKIVLSSPDGKSVKDVETNYTGKLRGTGLLYYKNLLFALGNDNYDTSPNAKHSSVLQIIDPSTNKIVRSFEKTTAAPTLFNDTTLDSRSVAYITNTRDNTIYTINTLKKNSKFESLFKSDEIPSPNGISISENNDKLFIATQKGIRIFDLKTKTLLPFEDSSTVGIDGLKFNKGKLYSLQNGQLISYQLNEKMDAIISKEVMLNKHYTFDVPTSLCIIDNVIYVLANSQFGKRNRVENKTIDKSKLTNTYILAIRI